jgi:hypothetical protein
LSSSPRSNLAIVPIDTLAAAASSRTPQLHHRDLHRRGNERALWENQGIDPLPIAASLWDGTHAVNSAAAELGDHINGLTKLNGKQLASGLGDAIQRQNDEAKPTVRAAN